MRPAFALWITPSLLVALTGLVALSEWGARWPGPLIPWAVLAVLALLTLQVRTSRRAFVAVGGLLTLWLALSDPSWQAVVLRGCYSAGFIGAFFTALTTLRNVAETSPAIGSAGRFLARQPPGRRYAALTLGGHLFALLLNYGAITLLGSLATASAAAEADPVIRHHRRRRMLLAIQRGFISSLPWSPLAFAMAITTALIPGASWAAAVAPGLGSAAIIAGTGWALDTIFKPRVTVPAASRARGEGSWRLISPLILLLLLFGVTVGGLHELTGIRIVGIVMVVVPVIALGWAGIQHGGGGLGFSIGKRLRDYLVTDLTGYRGEITLLMMAGYIGTVGAPLLLPLVLHSGLDPAQLPAWAVLVALVWIVPVLGQLGMNPILAVTLLAPLIPGASAMGVAPSAIVTAITAGWAMSGTTSPFTATTLMIGSFGQVSALHVGFRWNGFYVLATGALLTAWVLTYAFVLGA
ncbi:hypothetical protein [Antarcticimicrobium luteum]|uniref:H+/citrate symporter n=1 Tax=Antarcticimicrobium luteum TaxID=2547397 RepID=A0A4R5UQS7_9RHOB|nr:hypothetical protein [Antarcticimicrobium luteum]TDK41343.1 hypothetical protein E1832_21915 [Antarcticimicrobium luteum]